MLDEVSIQQVTRPDSSAKVTIRGSVRVIVYSIGRASELCDLTAVSPLATGTAQLTVTDNDFFVSLNRTNSFGLKLTGIASGDGGRSRCRPCPEPPSSGMGSSRSATCGSGSSQ